METLKPCPFCGGQAKIQVCDDEGNLRSEEYKADPWSGLSYMISHDNEANKDCPIASHYEDGGVIGTFLYESEEELTAAWNKRHTF
ncbi:hypothetical protein [Solibacillus isronensis]|uniref:hypothetical protein n=1 Tax=Solibacillus isronensis TaxID=412383 RepID=UPI0039A32501